ncbi:MAG: hypothetical protein ACOYZ7_15615 [Chloroflexota bacterium]
MSDKIRVGWLWFDNDTSLTLEDKVRRAAERYQNKFGHRPDVCYVHPQAMGVEEQQFGPMRVIAARHILPHHFWLGVAANGNGRSPVRAAV